MRGESSPRPDREHVFGRDRELHQLDAWINAVAAHSGGVVILEGEAGIGKTTLASEVAARATERGFATRLSRAYARSVSTPFGLAATAAGVSLRDIPTDVASASLSLLAAGAPLANSFVVNEWLIDSVQATTTVPLLLIIEDLHWADDASLQWIRSLAGRLGSLPIGILATTRTARLGSISMRFDTDVTTLALLGLDQRASREFAHDLLGSTPFTNALERNLDAAHGNPLLIRSVCEGARRGDQTPPNVHQEMQKRLAEVPSESIAILQMAAVLGADLSVTALSHMTGRRAAEVIDALAASAHTGIMHHDGLAYAFRHDLYRDAIADTLPADARRALHREAAITFASIGAPVAVVAQHFFDGATKGDRDAIEWLTRAAQELGTYAPVEALALLDRTAALCEGSPPDELLLVRLWALAAVARLEEAEALAIGLRSTATTDDERATLERALALVCFIAGRAQECGQHMEEVVRLTGESALRPRRLAELAFARLIELNYDDATRYAQHACDDGSAAGDAAAVVAGESVACFLATLRHDVNESRRLAASAVARADQPNATEAHVYQPSFVAALAFMEAEDLATCSALVRQGRAIAERTGAAWARPGLDGIAAFAALRAGNIDDAHAHATEAGLVSPAVDGFGAGVWAHAFLAQIALHRGQPESAEHHLAEARVRVQSGRAQLGLEQVALASAWLSASRGDEVSARHELEAVWDLFSALGIHAARREIAIDLVRFSVRTGDPDRAAKVVETMGETASRSGLLADEATAGACHAWMRGDPEMAFAAAERFAVSGRRLHEAHALAQAAELLAIRHNTASAKAVARRAIERYGACGASGRAQLIAATHRVQTRRTRPVTGVGSLTDTERRVALLVAEGRSNPVIAEALGISRRTVETHVSAAMRKLGVTSRVAIALAIHDRTTP